MSTNKLHALFFTARGAGPDDVSLWTEPVAALVDGEDLIAERTLGLRVGPFNPDSVAHLPLLFAVAGGYQMNEATVRELHARFGAWLDAPRDEARAAAEVVRRDDDLMLLRTSLGEWGVASEDESAPEASWFAGDDAEASARRMYASERNKVWCSCGEEVHEDDAITIDDGPDLCLACAEALRKDFEAKRFRCVATYEAGACGWEGTGAEVQVDGGDSACPTCQGEAAEIDEPAVPS